MALIVKDGKLVIYNGSLATDQDLCDCICGEAGGCCGRLLPGPSSLTGPNYYPLTLHCRLTKGSCAKPDPAVDFDATWNASILQWQNTDVDIDGDGSHYSLTTIGFTCGTSVWPATLSGGICSCGGSPGTCNFDLSATLTGGQCNPVDLSGTATVTGLNCCGNLGGGSMILTVWE